MFAQLLADVGEPHLRVVEDPEGTSDLRGIDVSVAFDDRKLTPLESRSHVAVQCSWTARFRRTMLTRPR